MGDDSSQSVTQLLIAWGEGDRAALDRLVPTVYSELRRIAHRYMGREAADNMLQTTALVNEAYLRLIDAQQVQWQNRAHFFAISARLMRRILVDAARSRNYLKRGGGAQNVELEEALAGCPQPTPELIALDDALKALFDLDSRKGQVVEMRFFGGLAVKEIAEVLKVSPETVLRDWKLAKAWLARELRKNPAQAEE